MKKFGLLALACLAVPGIAAAASDTLLFRLYLTDGTSVVSYGEFARVEDRVVFSMPAGGSEQPRFLAATLPAAAVDWPRTEAHAASTRYQWYALTRGEEDFRRLSEEVASVLNAVLLTGDRGRTLELARQARMRLSAWSRASFGYRQHDVAEILAVLDEAIAGLRAAVGDYGFELSLVATPATPELVLEPVAGMPSLREQADQALRVAMLTDRPPERVVLLQAALQLLREAGPMVPPRESATMRRFAESRIRHEQEIDSRYAAMVRRSMADAARGTARARVADVERVLERISREDARLGRRRPEVVQALNASVQAQVEAARHLRLLRDQWTIRRSLYVQYERSVGAQLLQLAKAEPALEAIRRLDGPAPETLVALRAQLRGGAERLERLEAPADLLPAHHLLLGAWRFAERAVDDRYEAARAASVSGAWEASSSAAGALLLFARMQQELRALLEPPQLR